jgi:hypothetical protein
VAGLWDPVQTAHLEQIESRNSAWQLVGWGYDLILLLVAAVGAVILVRRRAQIGPMVAVVLGVVVTAMVSNGNQRFRLAADPIVAIGAAVSVAAVVGHLMRRRSIIEPDR